MAAGEHRIHGTDEIAQVVGGGYQSRPRQVDLTFIEQVWQLRGEGEAANAHGHHQGDKAGK